MVPAVRPISISIVLTASPLRMAASGVTLEYTSIPVLCDAKLCHISSKCNQRKHLAPSAGFMKFCPSPPNRHFTTTIANTPPITASHHGRSCRKVQCQKQSRYNGAQVIDRLLFMYNLIKYPL